MASHHGQLHALEELAGHTRGRHFTEWIPTLDEYRKTKNDDDALELLAAVIDATERAGRVDGSGPAPAYTSRAAVIYRRCEDYDAEIAVLERFLTACTPAYRSNKNPSEIAQRLEAARKLRYREHGR